MRKERGYTAFEMVTVTGIIGIAVAAAAPSIIKSNRSYKLNAAAQQLAQAFESARFESLRNNSSQTVLLDRVNNTITINGRTINLPEGVTFQTQTSSNEVPDVIRNAATNGANGTVAGQETNEKTAISFPYNSSNAKYIATFNSRGMPNVQPGVLNWVYLTNANGEKIAVTLSSAGSANTWRKNGMGVWKDGAGNSGGGASGSGS